MLIPCPHCGKQISDKAEKCVHCDAVLKQDDSSVKEEVLTPAAPVQAPQPKQEQKEAPKQESAGKIDYFTLSDSERKKLLKRFKREVPEHSKALKAEAVFGVFFMIGVYGMLFALAGIILDIICTMKWLNTVSPPTWVFVLLIGWFALEVYFIGFSIFAILLIRIVRTPVLRNYKHMEIWAKEQNIENFFVRLANPKIERQYREMTLDD